MKSGLEKPVARQLAPEADIVISGHHLERGLDGVLAIPSDQRRDMVLMANSEPDDTRERW